MYELGQAIGMSSLVPRLLPLRALTINFSSPRAQGGAWERG